MKKNLNLICYIIFCFIFIIINILFLYNKMPHVITFGFNKNMRYLILGITMLIEILFCSIIYITYKKNISFEKIFLMVTVPLGLFFLVFIPVGQIPDEQSHFARIYEVSMGHLMTNENGRDMPAEIVSKLTNEKQNGNYSDILKNVKTKNTGKKYHYVILNTAVYNFICYLPQTVGVLIGKLFNAPILMDAYLGRLTNFICFISLIYLSIKYIPFAKKILMLISLLPITLQQGISLSPDVITYSSCVLLISYTSYLAYEKKEILKKDYFVLSMLCIIVSLCKIVYLPVCLILFILPKDKFQSLKDKNIKILSLAFVVITINLIWLKIATGFLVETHTGVNPMLQKDWIITHPFSYIKIILYSIYKNFKFYLYTMLGQSLELLNVDITKFYPNIALVMIIALTFIERLTKTILKIKDKLLFIGILCSVMLLIFTSLYIQWTPLKSSIIDGVQGRYFLPILCLVPFIFFKTKKNKYEYDLSGLNIYVLTFSMFFNICALMYIFAVNY